MNLTLAHKTKAVPASAANFVDNRYSWISLDLAEPSLGAPLIQPLSTTDTFILSTNNLGTERGWVFYEPIDTDNLFVGSLTANSIITTLLSTVSTIEINRFLETQVVTGEFRAGSLIVEGGLTANSSIFEYLTAKNFILGPGDDEGNISGKSASFENLSAGNLFLDAISGDGRNLNPVGELIFNRLDSSARMFSIGLPLSGKNNFYFGLSAGTQSTAGNDNIFVGKDTGYFNRFGSNNIFLGTEAGYTSISSNNIYIGVFAGGTIRGGVKNIVLGSNSGPTSFLPIYTGSSDFVLIGNDIISNGQKNVIIGNDTNAGLLSGVIAIGPNAPIYGSNDVSIGDLYYGKTNNYVNITNRPVFPGTSNNIYIGNAVAPNNTFLQLSSNNIFLGAGAGANNKAGRLNTFIGVSASSDNTDGINNIVLGYNSSNNNFNNTIVFGRDARALKNNNLILGSPTFSLEGLLYGTLSAYEVKANYFSGDSAFFTNLTSVSHVVQVRITEIVVSTLSALSSTDFLSISGDFTSGSLSARTLSGDGFGINPMGPFRYHRPTKSINLFQNTLSPLTGGTDNNFFGFGAGRCNTTGGNNNFLGSNAGRYNTTGNFNNFFGPGAGFCNTTGGFNNLLGYRAGYCNTTGGFNNFLGDGAGLYNTTGGYNNFFGTNAGIVNTTGFNNIAIGFNATPDKSGLQNSIAIGTGARVLSSNHMVFGSPTEPLTSRIWGPLTVEALSANTTVRALSVFTEVLEVDRFDIGNFELDDFTATTIVVQSLTSFSGKLSGDGYGLNPVGELKFDRINKNAGMFNLDVVPRGGFGNIIFGNNAGKGYYRGSSNVVIGNNAAIETDARNEEVSGVNITNPGSYPASPQGQFRVQFVGGSPTVAASGQVVFTDTDPREILGINITNPGQNYQSTPSVRVDYFINNILYYPLPGLTATGNAFLGDFSNNNTIVIGNSAQSSKYSNTVVIGTFAKANRDNSLVIGSEDFPYEHGEINGPLDVKGHFSATTKSFLIKHPSKKNKHLQYGSLEGPELGVYFRGKTNKNVIKLPKVWEHLVHNDSITVQLTPIGKSQPLHVVEFNNKFIKVEGATGMYFYTVYGERKDVPKLLTEV